MIRRQARREVRALLRGSPLGMGSDEVGVLHYEAYDWLINLRLQEVRRLSLHSAPFPTARPLSHSVDLAADLPHPFIPDLLLLLLLIMLLLLLLRWSCSTPRLPSGVLSAPSTLSATRSSV